MSFTIQPLKKAEWMEKEFYKLFLVVIMIISSFSIAFFIGRKVALSEQHISQQNFEEVVQKGSKVLDHSEEWPKESVTEAQSGSITHASELTDTALADSENLEDTSNQRGEVQEYKNQLISESGQEQTSGIYGLLVDSFLKKEMAMEKSAKLKLKFPAWPIFFKRDGSVYKVYLGPFDNMRMANDFLQEVKASKQFPTVILEQVIELKKNDSKSI